jgi:phage baseplate assembly protein W
MVAPIIYGKKCTLVDEKLVVQDFINALNIPQGQKVGNPAYGTTLWTFVFEPNTADVQFQLQNELQRVANLDSRLIVNSINVYTQDNGILLEVELAVAPFNNAQSISIFFDNFNNTASLQ